MDKHRKEWNDRHKLLRAALEQNNDRKNAIDLFLTQHAMVHTSKLSKSGLFSFEDEILSGLEYELYRKIPRKGNHSIAWILWHLTRVEDVTMNLLIADQDQVLHKDNRLRKMKIKVRHTGNGMTNYEIIEFSSQINIKALTEYRLTVGRETRKIVKKLNKSDFIKKVDPDRVCRIWDEKAVLKNAKGIVDYWANRTIAGLLLMPPTRHCILHLNEIRRIEKAIQ